MIRQRTLFPLIFLSRCIWFLKRTFTRHLIHSIVFLNHFNFSSTQSASHIFCNFKERACVMTAGDKKSAFFWRWCNFVWHLTGLASYGTEFVPSVYIRFPVHLSKTHYTLSRWYFSYFPWFLLLFSLKILKRWLLSRVFVFHLLLYALYMLIVFLLICCEHALSKMLYTDTSRCFSRVLDTTSCFEEEWKMIFSFENT